MLYSKHMKFFGMLLACVLISTACATPVSAAGTWEQMESGSLNTIEELVRVGTTLVGLGNGVTRSIDGVTWTKNTSVSSDWLYGAAVNAQGALKAVGDGTFFLTSTNQGSTWSSDALNINASRLYAIAFGGGAGYIVGADGILMYTSAQDANWFQSISPVVESLNAVSALGDGRTAFAVGDGGIFLKTADGGVTWSNLGRIAEEHLKGVVFTTEQVGWVVGTNGTFVKTTDGGLSWSKVVVPGFTTQTLSAIDLSGQTLVAAGQNIALRSEDGGSTWSAQTFGDNLLTFKDVLVESNGDAWIAGTRDDVRSNVYAYKAAVAPVVPTPTPAPTPAPTVPVTLPTDFGEASSGDLIKTHCSASASVSDPCRAVYFLSEDGKRHAFPNERVYFTWFADFSRVVEVSSTFMASRTLGKNVTYHPGTRMVKFVTVPKVYVVERKGVLRPIASEQVASGLYGSTWNQQIDDVPDAFYGNYTFGEPVESISDFHRAEVQASTPTLNDNF